MLKTLKAGSEVDSYCTKCKMDLNHRIIAMVGDTVKRVECLTCGGHHNYRRPKTVRESAGVARASGTRASRGTSARSASAGRAAAAAAAKDPRRTWEAAIMGRGAADFTPYNMATLFVVGQLVRHSKFGEGVVTNINEGKAEIVFEAGPKTLIHGKTA